MKKLIGFLAIVIAFFGISLINTSSIYAAQDSSAIGATVKWALHNNGTLVINCSNIPDGHEDEYGEIIASGDNLDTSKEYYSFNIPWDSNRDSIKSVIFDNLTRPKNMAYWFYYCRNLKSFNSKNLDTKNVTNMSFMFYYCSSLQDVTSLSSWDVSSVTDMNAMFSYCRSLQDVTTLSSWDVSSVTDMSYMFLYCDGLRTLSLSNWNPKQSVSTHWMFDGCPALTTIICPYSWTTSDSTDMFQYCTSLVSLSSGASYDSSKTDGSMANPTTGYFTSSAKELCVNNIPKSVTVNVNKTKSFPIELQNATLQSFQCEPQGLLTDAKVEESNLVLTAGSSGNTGTVTLTFYVNDPEYGTGTVTRSIEVNVKDTSAIGATVKWALHKNGTLVINCDDIPDGHEDEYGEIIASGDLDTSNEYLTTSVPWYSNKDSIKSVTFDNLTRPKNMACWFFNCSNLVSFNSNNSKNLDTKNVTDMGHMFCECRSLQDVTSFSSWDVSSVTDMNRMFYSCDSLQDVTSLSSWDVSSVTSMRYMFYGCNRLRILSLLNWNPKQSINTIYMFQYCPALTTIVCPYSWTPSDGTEMFQGCTSLVSLSSGVSYNNSSKTGGSMANPTTGYFTSDAKYLCVVGIPLSTFVYTGKTRTIPIELRNATLQGFQCEPQGLITDAKVEESNLVLTAGSSVNSGKLTLTFDVDDPEYGTGTITKEVNVNVVDPSSVGATVNWALHNDGTLVINCDDIPDGHEEEYGEIIASGGLDTSNKCDSYSGMPWYLNRSSIKSVTFDNLTIPKNMAYWFYDCVHLNSFNSENLDTKNVTDMRYMFYNCDSLQDVSSLSSWTVSSVTDMSWMFGYCDALQDVTSLSSWDVSSVTNMSDMFDDCDRLRTLFLLNWNPKQSINTNSMFQFCLRLTTIVCPYFWTTSSSTYMFRSCTPLVSLSSGASYDPSKIDGNMANPTTGYFTSKEYAYANWCLYDDGALVINGDNQPNYNGHSGIKASGDDLCLLCINDDSEVPWRDYRTEIESVEFAKKTTPYSLAYWFYGAKNLDTITSLTNLDASNLEDLNSAFYGCESLTSLNQIKDLKPEALTNLSNTFEGCTKLQDISALLSWDTSHVTTFKNLFAGCSMLKDVEALKDLNTESARDLSGFFSGCSSIEQINLNNWMPDDGCDVSKMFADCILLQRIVCKNYWSDVVAENDNMFTNCPNLKNEMNEVYWSSDAIGHTMANPAIGYFTDPARENWLKWAIYDDGTLVINGNNAANEHGNVKYSGRDFDITRQYSSDSTRRTPWFLYRNEITNVTIANPISPISMAYWFYSANALTSVDLSNVNIGSLENMTYAFFGCSALEEIDLSTWAPNQGLEMRNAFYGCSSLDTVWCANEWDAKGTNAFGNCKEISSLSSGKSYDLLNTGASMASPTTGYFTDPAWKGVTLEGLPNQIRVATGKEQTYPLTFSGMTLDSVSVESDSLANAEISDTSSFKVSGQEVGEGRVILTFKKDGNTLTARIPIQVYDPTAISNANASTTQGVSRQADPSTMDTYNDFLNVETSSRVAGRVWADKSVFAYGDTPSKDFNGKSLELDEKTDGVTGEIDADGDFMHVFSAMGSSQILDEPTPTDTMLLLDISGSMGNGPNSHQYTQAEFEAENSEVPAVKTIKAANEAIRKIMTNSPDSRIGIAVYGSTSVILLPLGHYVIGEDTDILSCTYIGNYSTQGVHFKVTAHVRERDTREIKDFAVDNAGQSSDDAHGTQSSARDNNVLPGTGGHTTGSGTLQDPYHVGHITNQQAGLACAMEELACDENTETTWTSLDGTVRQRMPALIHLTDGQASDMAWIQDPANPDSPDPWSRVLNNWYNVDISYDKAYNTVVGSGNLKYNARQMSSTAGDVAVVTFQTILTASYYKEWVNLHYAANIDPSEVRTLSCYSIYASDTTPYEDLTPINKALVDLNMDPSTSLYDHGSPSADTYDAYIDTTYELLKRFSEGEVITDEFDTVNTTKSKLNASKAQIENDIHGVSADNLNFKYVDANDFYHVSFSEVSQIFDTVVTDLMQEAFSPISGKSDLKTEDALTYMDPIGDLMDIRSVQGMVLFGSYYPIQAAAVYDYSFMQGRAGFQMGWYKGNIPSAATWGGTGVELGDGSTIPDPALALKTYKSSAEAWADGWRYLVNDDIAAQFVPNFNVGDKHLYTDYTFYRLTVSADERDELRINSAYADEVPYVPDGADYTQFKGVYKLSDIRIWAEDTGDYDDPIAGDPSIETDASYDEALWVNIPVNALPLRVVHIGGSASMGYTYSTNTNAPFGESLPLRIIYSVSVTDEVKNEDGEIDLDKVDEVDPDYKRYYLARTDEKVSDRGIDCGGLEFRSNYYNPNNTYHGYVTHDATGDYTFGDPVVSFPPSNENRYYIFQKPLTLYDAGVAYSETESGPEQIPISDDAAMESFEGTYHKVTDELKSDEWYYMVIDYYEVVDGVCKPTRLAVTRKGSEFGSGLGEGQYGAFVCWYEESTGATADYTADAGHGKPQEGTWVAAAAKGGIRTGDLAQSVVSKGGDKTGKYVTGNVTRTANNRLLSAIGKNSTAGNVQIDAYLGNNGRLWVLTERPVELPHTGGIGVFAIVASGSALVTASLVGIAVTQMKKNPKHAAHPRTRSAYRRNSRPRQ